MISITPRRLPRDLHYFKTNCTLIQIPLLLTCNVQFQLEVKLYGSCPRDEAWKFIVTLSLLVSSFKLNLDIRLNLGK
jgi:hypothetical protein